MAHIFDGLRPYSYDLIMADPPWRFKTRSDKGITEKGAGGHYDTMTLDQIKAMPVQQLAKPDCLLWLWATNPMLPLAFETMEAWGFEFKTAGSWEKITKNGKQGFGTGYILRCSNEPFLIGTRGNPKTTRSTRSSFRGLVRENSRKPDEAFDVAAGMIPNARKLELFSRQIREGWSAWGNELEKF
ncbi:MAG: MT-A70 family methyltransferase [Pseudomonadota bacterium]|nr:MT-A70 family methyltransferase [Pseudomonadota bacterium]